MNEYLRFILAVAVAGGLLFLGSHMDGGASSGNSAFKAAFGNSDDITTITNPWTFEENLTLGNAASDLFRAVGRLHASSTLQSTGAVRFYSTLLVDGALHGSSTMQVTGASRHYATTTFDGANIVLSGSNTATSSVSGLGCIGGYATSTATPVIFTFGTVATTGAVANGLSNHGFLLWQYGTCPRTI